MAQHKPTLYAVMLCRITRVVCLAALYVYAYLNLHILTCANSGDACSVLLRKTLSISIIGGMRGSSHVSYMYLFEDSVP